MSILESQGNGNVNQVPTVFKIECGALHRTLHLQNIFASNWMLEKDWTDPSDKSPIKENHFFKCLSDFTTEEVVDFVSSFFINHSGISVSDTKYANDQREHVVRDPGKLFDDILRKDLNDAGSRLLAYGVVVAIKRRIDKYGGKVEIKEI